MDQSKNKLHDKIFRDEKEKLRTLTEIRRSDADQAREHKKRSHETKIGRGKDDLSHDEVI